MLYTKQTLKMNHLFNCKDYKFLNTYLVMKEQSDILTLAGDWA